MAAHLIVTDNITGVEDFSGTYRSRAHALAALTEELLDWTDAHVIEFDAAASDGGITGEKVFDIIRVVDGLNVETVSTAYLTIT